MLLLTLSNNLKNSEAIDRLRKFELCDPRQLNEKAMTAVATEFLGLVHWPECPVPLTHATKKATAKGGWHNRFSWTIKEDHPNSRLSQILKCT